MIEDTIAEMRSQGVTKQIREACESLQEISSFIPGENTTVGELNDRNEKDNLSTGEGKSRSGSAAPADRQLSEY